MKAVALICGWCFCVFATLGLLRPKLLEFGSHRISADYDVIPDRLVSWAIIVALWWGWIQCARNYEGEPDDFRSLPACLIVGVLAGLALWAGYSIFDRLQG